MCQQHGTDCKLNKVVDPITGAVTKYQIMVEILPEELKACSIAPDGSTNDVLPWLHNAIYNKARQCIDEVVTKTGKGSNFTPIDIKRQIVTDIIPGIDTFTDGTIINNWDVRKAKTEAEFLAIMTKQQGVI